MACASGKAWAALAAAAALYALSVAQVSPLLRKNTDASMQVRLPPFVQVLLAGGDRYLAADINVLRSLVVEVGRATPQQYRVQAFLQADASWFNPRHEDNYYLANGTLSWSGQADAALYILQRASASRPFDWQPDFFRAAVLYMVKHDTLTAADILRQLAARVDEPGQKEFFASVAAVWYQRGYEPAQALLIIEGMAQRETSPRLKRNLQLQAQHLGGLVALQTAAQRYVQRYGHAPSSLEELRDRHLIAVLPSDPFGVGYTLSPEGVPVFNSQVPRKQ